MTKFDEVLVRLAYVAKLLIGLAGMGATALLGLSDLPAGWKFPLLVVAALASAVALFRVPNGPSLSEAKADAELREILSGSRKPQTSGGDVERSKRVYQDPMDDGDEDLDDGLPGA